MLNTILLQAAGGEGGGMSFMIMIVLMIVIFYFFMIRPQNKRQKKIREERAALVRGSRVITSGGIYGKVSEVKETTFVIEIANNVRITVAKECVYPDNATEDVVTAANQGNQN